MVVHEDRVLLVKRRNPPDAGLWGFPGGHVELGESGLAAAARELEEETSIIAKPISYLTNIDVLSYDENGGVEFHFLLAAVLCAYRSGRPQAGDDASSAAWHECGSVLAGDLDCSAAVDEVLRLAIASEKALKASR